MIRFAALLSQGAPQPQAFAAYQAEVGPEDGATALRLLSGQRPKRLAPPATLLDWVAKATNTPAFLIEACLKTCPDKAELAALLLPPPTTATIRPCRGFRPTERRQEACEREFPRRQAEQQDPPLWN
jgi:hypothetical protein